MTRLGLLACFSLLRTIGFGQTEKDCSLMRDGTFKYLEAMDTSAFFVITDSSHTEYYGQGKYFIKSQMIWVRPCQYILRMKENTIPGFPFKPEDVMMVTINKIEGDIIYYTSEVKGWKWESKVRKLK